MLLYAVALFEHVRQAAPEDRPEWRCRHVQSHDLSNLHELQSGSRPRSAPGHVRATAPDMSEPEYMDKIQAKRTEMAKALMSSSSGPPAGQPTATATTTTRPSSSGGSRKMKFNARGVLQAPPPKYHYYTPPGEKPAVVVEQPAPVRPTVTPVEKIIRLNRQTHGEYHRAASAGRIRKNDPIRQGDARNKRLEEMFGESLIGRLDNAIGQPRYVRHQCSRMCPFTDLYM